MNARGISLKNPHFFHTDECLDWEGRSLPKGHPPGNFRAFTEREFYGGIRHEFAVPDAQRHWLAPSTMEQVRIAVAEAPIDITVGGWGQDGHVAYNHARRHPFHHATLEEIAIGAPFNPYRVFQGAFAPYWLLEHRGICTGAKLCYIRLLGFAGKDARCYPSLEKLGASLGVSERQVRDYIKELERAACRRAARVAEDECVSLRLDGGVGTSEQFRSRLRG